MELSGVALEETAETLNLFTADAGTHRVLVHRNVDARESGVAADSVMGQPTPYDYKANGGSDSQTNGFDTPLGISVDPTTQKVAISDTKNGRILIFSSPDQAVADGVFGQIEIGEPSGETNPGSGSDPITDPETEPETDPETDPATDPETDLGSNPDSGKTPDSGCSTCDSDMAPKSSVTEPQYALYFSSIAYHNGILYAAAGEMDGNQEANRIFIYDTVTGQPVQMPHRVLGQPYNELALQQGRTLPPKRCNQGAIQPTAATLCDVAGIAVDNDGNLWVADRGNNRVLFYENPVQAPVEGSTPFDPQDLLERVTADSVIGQINFATRDAWSGASESARFMFAEPTGITIARGTGHLWVTDSANGRVLQFATLRQVDPEQAMPRATAVLGHPTFVPSDAGFETSVRTFNNPTSVAVSSDGKLLLVGDSGNSRVMRFVFDSAPTISGAGTVRVEVDSTTQIALTITDADGDSWQAPELLPPIDSGLSINANVVTFSAIGRRPGDRVYARVAVQDDSSQQRRSVATLVFHVVGPAQTEFSRSEGPAERDPLVLDEAKTGCAQTTTIPMLLLVALLLPWRRRARGGQQPA